MDELLNDESIVDEKLTEQPTKYRPHQLAKNNINDWFKYDYILDRHIMLKILHWAQCVNNNTKEKINKAIGSTRYNMITTATKRTLERVNKTTKGMSIREFAQYRRIFAFEFRKELGLPENYKRVPLLDLFKILLDNVPKDFISVYPHIRHQQLMKKQQLEAAKRKKEKRKQSKQKRKDHTLEAANNHLVLESNEKEKTKPTHNVKIIVKKKLMLKQKKVEIVE